MIITKKRVILSLLILFIIVIGYLIMTGSYPVAFVGGRSITLRDFKKDSEITIFYYKKASETYDPGNMVVVNSPEAKKEIERAVLDKLVENVLIDRELEKRLKNGEIEEMVNKKIENIISGKDVEKQVKTLYDIPLNDFKERLLKPQAKQEILSDRLLLENVNFDDWLKQAKSESKVIILLTDFEWKNNKVVIK